LDAVWAQSASRGGLTLLTFSVGSGDRNEGGEMITINRGNIFRQLSRLGAFRRNGNIHLVQKQRGNTFFSVLVIVLLLANTSEIAFGQTSTSFTSFECPEIRNSEEKTAILDLWISEAGIYTVSLESSSPSSWNFHLSGDLSFTTTGTAAKSVQVIFTPSTVVRECQGKFSAVLKKDGWPVDYYRIMLVRDLGNLTDTLIETHYKVKRSDGSLITSAQDLANEFKPVMYFSTQGDTGNGDEKWVPGPIADILNNSTFRSARLPANEPITEIDGDNPQKLALYPQYDFYLDLNGQDGRDTVGYAVGSRIEVVGSGWDHSWVLENSSWNKEGVRIVNIVERS